MAWKLITLRLYLVQICLSWDLKMLSVEKIIRVRNIALGHTGLICLLYALLVILIGWPDPTPWWVPGMFGLLSGVTIFSLFGMRAQSWRNRSQMSCPNTLVTKPTALAIKRLCCSIRFLDFWLPLIWSRSAWAFRSWGLWQGRPICCLLLFWVSGPMPAEL